MKTDLQIVIEESSEHKIDTITDVVRAKPEIVDKAANPT